MTVKQDISAKVFEVLFTLKTDPDVLVDYVLEKEDYLELVCCMANDELIYLTWFEHDDPDIEFAPKGTEVMDRVYAHLHSLLPPQIPKSIEFARQQDLLEPPSC